MKCLLLQRIRRFVIISLEYAQSVESQEMPVFVNESRKKRNLLWIEKQYQMDLLMLIGVSELNTY